MVRYRSAEIKRAMCSMLAFRRAWGLRFRVQKTTKTVRQIMATRQKTSRAVGSCLYTWSACHRVAAVRRPTERGSRSR